MINVLFTLVLVEMGLIFILLFKTPLRKLMMMALDKMKRGRGPLVARTVATTLIVILGSVAYNLTSVHNRLRESSVINPTDEVLIANHLLEAFLLGFSLFLAILIDRLHYYIKELELLRSSGFDSAKKHRRDYVEMETEGIDARSDSEQLHRRTSNPVKPPTPERSEVIGGKIKKPSSRLSP